MSDETLKPCPFCGGDDVNMGKRPHFREGKGSGWTVLCADCGGSIGYIERPDGHFYAEYDTKSEAIAAWNTRYHCGLLLDELGVSERTCRNIAEPDEMSDDPFTCSECGGWTAPCLTPIEAKARVAKGMYAEHVKKVVDE